MKNLVNRFLKYVSFNTQSNPAKSCCPSSAGQMTFAEYLRDELTELGLRQVSLDEHGYVMAKLPSNVDFAVPAIGFIAHMDTAPDASGRNIAPQFIEEYQGGDIALGKGDEVLSPIRYPELHQLHGHNLITTDGRTLLGADDKAGIAEIVTAIEELIQHPEIAHGDICIGFTPDEEIGRGANLFDVERFGAQWAYTVDGGPLGELEYENFNAANAEVIIYGNNVHPGWAKDKMVNAMNIAARFQMMMPQAETPEQTEGYQGFYHLKSAKMSVAKSQLSYILRDFEREGLEARKAYMRQQVDTLNAQLHHGRVELQMEDCYYNMREMIEPHPHIVELAKQAMMECDVEPVIKPIRGGTDGARLSFMGLPCPNLFTGGYNFHGIHEFVSVEAMEQAVKVILRLSEKTAQYHRE